MGTFGIKNNTDSSNVSIGSIGSHNLVFKNDSLNYDNSDTICSKISKNKKII